MNCIAANNVTFFIFSSAFLFEIIKSTQNDAQSQDHCFYKELLFLGHWKGFSKKQDEKNVTFAWFFINLWQYKQMLTCETL